MVAVNCVAPFDVEVAEPAGSRSRRMMAARYSSPQQAPASRRAAQLGMDVSPFRKRLRSPVCCSRPAQIALRSSAVSASSSGSGQLIPIHRGAATYSAIAVRPIPTSGRSPDRSPAQHTVRRRLSKLPHRQSLGGRSDLPLRGRPKEDLPRSDRRQTCPPHPINRVAAFRPDPGAGVSDRNPWPFPSESVPLCLGFRKPSLAATARSSFPKVAGSKQIAFLLLPVRARQLRA